MENKQSVKLFDEKFTLKSPGDYDDVTRSKRFIVFEKNNFIFTFDSVKQSFDWEHPEIAGKKIFLIRNDIIVVEEPGESAGKKYKLYPIGLKKLIECDFTDSQLFDFHTTYSCYHKQQTRGSFLVLFHSYSSRVHVYDFEKSKWSDVIIKHISKFYLYNYKLYYTSYFRESKLLVCDLRTEKKYLVKDFSMNGSYDIRGIDDVLFFGHIAHSQFFFYDAGKMEEIEIPDILPGTLLPIYSVKDKTFCFLRNDGLYAGNKRITDYSVPDFRNSDVFANRIYEIFTGVYSEWRHYVDIETGQVYKCDNIVSDCCLNAIYGKPIAENRMIFYSIE